MTRVIHREWANLKRVTESLFAPKLQGRLVLHHSPYSMNGTPSTRQWITLDGEIIWDYPVMFYTEYEAQYPRIKPSLLINKSWWDWYDGDTARTLGRYIDTPHAELLEPVLQDHYGLCDILRAADRRIGFARLAWWSFTGNPWPAARRVMGVRFEGRKPKTRRRA